MRIAVGRAVQDGIPGTCLAVVADAAHLPFRDNCFDVINHCDVLCCLVQKREVLAECLRVVRPAGRMAFSVIYIQPGLSSADHARAVETAPELAASDTDYPTLLAATGWVTRQRHDLTAEFMANCIRKLRVEESLRADLEPLTSAAEFDARHAWMRRRIRCWSSATFGASCSSSNRRSEQRRSLSQKAHPPDPPLRPTTDYLRCAIGG